jgi:hypothetical protein
MPRKGLNPKEAFDENSHCSFELVAAVLGASKIVKLNTIV